MHPALVLALTFGLVTVTTCTSRDLVEEFEIGFDIFHETGIQTSSFQAILSDYALSDAVRNTPNWQFGNPGEQRIPICVMCDLAVNKVMNAYANGTSIEEIALIITDLCISFNIQPARVCEGAIAMYIDVVEYLLINTQNLTSDRLCAIVFQGDGCGEFDSSMDWTIDLGPPPLKTLVNYVPHTPKAEPLNIVQVTDIHYDPSYMVGGNADCGEPMCCRSDQGIPEFPNTTAGRWGDYRGCDISWEVVTDAMRHITTQHQQIAYVYMTGDLIDHGVWDLSRTRVNDTLQKINEELKNTFGDIPVFPCLGNHDTYPLNIYVPTYITDEKVSSVWLYEILADLWSVWLPPDTRETILRGGFYTVLVRPGFRVVALNNNQCFTDNYFLVYDTTDPDGQLQWLVGVLQEAEANGEKVHLLYHLRTGGLSCYKVWSREFNRIINRFETTVVTQFSGHTHHDEFHIFYSHEAPDRANGVLYSGGSLTSASNVNPNYRLYNVDPDNWSVVDHETWIYNMTAANLTPDETPDWFKMYSFKEAYGVSSLEPVELDRLAHDMASNSSIMQQYFEFYYKLGDPKMEEGCDQRCYDDLLCSILKTDSSSNSTRCQDYISI